MTDVEKKIGTVDDPTQDPNELKTKVPPARELEEKNGKTKATGPVRGSAEANEERKTVTMFLPTRVTLTVGGHLSHTFGPGIAEVPEEFADHSYLKDNGAYVYKRGQAEPEEARGRFVDSISGLPVAPEETIPGDTKEISIFDRDPSSLRATEVHQLEHDKAQEIRREERLNARESEDDRESRLDKQREDAEKSRKESAKLNRDSEGATSSSEKTTKNAKKDPVESADSIAAKKKEK